MEKLKRHKVCMVWLLLTVFTLPFSVKIVHIHNTAEHSHHSCSGKSHSYQDCRVCQFTLSSFTEAMVVDYDFKVIFFNFNPVISFQHNSYQQVLFSYGLRAPPSVV